MKKDVVAPDRRVPARPVGAASEVEAEGEEAPHRGCDPWHRAGFEEGIVAEGSVVLLNAATALTDGWS